MMARAEDHQRIVNYLLGDMPEAEKLALEKRFFMESDHFEYMLAVEDELMYAHLGGLLSPTESSRFEQRFLSSSDGRAKARFAGELLPRLAATRPLQAWSWLPIAAAIAGIGLFSAVIWQVRETGRLRSELAVERSRVLDKPVGPPIAKAPFRVAFALSPGLVRGEEAKILRLPSGAEAVFQLSNTHPTGGEPYRASVRTAEGIEVWSQAGLRSAEVVIPPGILFPGDFEIILEKSAPSGTYRETGDYHFTIVK